jgi:hypothetical protein
LPRAQARVYTRTGERDIRSAIRPIPDQGSLQRSDARQLKSWFLGEALNRDRQVSPSAYRLPESIERRVGRPHAHGEHVRNAEFFHAGDGGQIPEPLRRQQVPGGILTHLQARPEQILASALRWLIPQSVRKFERD